MLNSLTKYLVLIFILPSGLQASDLSSYQTVNEYPQLSVGPTQVNLYWAVWRGFTIEEKSWIEASDSPALLSSRTISWQLEECDASEPTVKDSEHFFYYDKLEFDSSGEILPIREAFRPGYRYINMITMTSQQLRKAGRLPPTPRLPDDTAETYRARKKVVRDIWRQKTEINATKGYVVVEASHRLFASVDESWFLDLSDYTNQSSPWYRDFLTYAPTTWPIYYDERAHKPHHILHPEAWDDRPYSSRKLAMIFTWNWCEDELDAQFIFPEGGLPVAGPNRPGRADGGTVQPHINIYSRDDFEALLLDLR